MSFLDPLEGTENIVAERGEIDKHRAATAQDYILHIIGCSLCSHLDDELASLFPLQCTHLLFSPFLPSISYSSILTLQKI
jgi:hypothetical protein